MPIDTSSYYPKSPLGDGEEETRNISGSLFPDRSSKDSGPGNGNESEQQGKDPDILPGGENCSLWEELSDSIATAMSWIFVPLMMPVYGILLIFGLSVLSAISFQSKLVFTLVVLGFNMIVPAILVLLLKRMKIVDDIGLNGRKERGIPYIISIVCMCGTGVFMYYKGAPLWCAMFFGGGAAVGLVNFLVNFRWKISAHAAGIAGIPALLLRMLHDGGWLVDPTGWLIGSILAAGLLGSARIWLGRHTLMQVLAGYTVGFCGVYFMTMI